MSNISLYKTEQNSSYIYTGYIFNRNLNIFPFDDNIAYPLYITIEYAYTIHQKLNRKRIIIASQPLSLITV